MGREALTLCNHIYFSHLNMESLKLSVLFSDFTLLSLNKIWDLHGNADPYPCFLTWLNTERVNCERASQKCKWLMVLGEFILR